MADESGELKKYHFILERYRAFRSYIEHEDRLTGDRLNRTLVVHGFLLASYGFLVQARVSSAMCLAPAQHCSSESVPYMQVILLLTSVMLPVIAAMGIFTTLSARQGVGAAKRAVISVREKWPDYDHDYLQMKELGLPGLTGGGDPEVNGRGEGSTKRLLRYLLYLWLLVLFISAYGAIGHLQAIQDVANQLGSKVSAAVVLH